MDRRYTYLAFVGGLALLAGSAVAQIEIPSRRGFEVQLAKSRRLQGRSWRPCGPDAHNLRPVARRGRGACHQRARLFHRGHWRQRQILLLGELRAAGRHRHPGRQPSGHHCPAAAWPDRRPRLQGLPDPARRRHAEMAARQLRCRPIVGRPRHLQGQGRQPAPLRLPLQDRREEPRLVRAGELRGRRLRSPDDDGRTEGADRTDRRRRRHAMVHRTWVQAARPAGRRPTGSRT